MDLPRHVLAACDPPPALLEGLGVRPLEVLRTPPAGHYYAVYATEAQVRALTPDFRVLVRLPSCGVGATARGVEADFVSRFFAPSLGIPEDPVTGSAHCALTPDWAGRLGRVSLYARQVSARGGDLYCRDDADRDRVTVSGRAVKYLDGWLSF
jgi:predicted PhzF superfamily epimerase YddE/YHI9